MNPKLWNDIKKITKLYKFFQRVKAVNQFERRKNFVVTVFNQFTHDPSQLDDALAKGDDADFEEEGAWLGNMFSWLPIPSSDPDPANDEEKGKTSKNRSTTATKSAAAPKKGESWWSGDDDVDNDIEKNNDIELDTGKTLDQELDMQLDALETKLNEKDVLSREDNLKLRKLIARKVMRKIEMNKEMDKLPYFQRIKQHHHHFNKELFVLEVLRQCDKLVGKAKRDRQFARKSFSARALIHTQVAMRKLSGRLAQYGVDTAKSMVPFTIPNTMINEVLGTFLANISASFCDEDYIKAIAETGDFARPDPSWLDQMYDSAMGAVTDEMGAEDVAPEGDNAMDDNEDEEDDGYGEAEEDDAARDDHHFHLTHHTEAHRLAAMADTAVFTNATTNNPITVTRIDAKNVEDAFFEMKKKVWIKLAMNMAGCDLEPV